MLRGTFRAHHSRSWVALFLAFLVPTLSDHAGGNGDGAGKGSMKGPAWSCSNRKDLLEFLSEDRLMTDFRSSSPCTGALGGLGGDWDCKNCSTSGPQEDVCLNAIARGAHWCFPTAAELKAAGRCASCGDKMKDRLLKEIRTTLNPQEGCDRAVAAPLPVYGFGATFHYSVLQLKRALSANLAISFSGFFIYAPDSCPEGDWSCVMQPASHTCELPVVQVHWPNERKRAMANIAGAKAAWEDGFFGCCSARGIAHEAIDCERWYQLRGALVHARCGERSAAVPPAYAELGNFWFISTLAGYLFAPRHDTESWKVARGVLDAIAKNKAGGTIGVQIRRGDACHSSDQQHMPHNQRCIPTEEYINKIKVLGSLYGARHVFLATNGDSSLVQELKAALPNYIITTQSVSHPDKFQCCPDGVLECKQHAQCLPMSKMVLHMANAGAASFTQDEKAEGNGSLGSTMTPAQLYNEVVADIVALASCDYLVGTFTSQVSRLAFELSYYWRGYVIPYSTLDIPWCWFGYRRGNVTHINGTVFDYGC